MKLLKQAVRKSVRETLTKISQEQVDHESVSIVKSIKNHDAYLKSEHVCFFLPMPKEVDLTNLLYDTLQTSKKCYIPVMMDVDIEMLRVKDVDDLKTFVKNKWGILEPTVESIPTRENLLENKPEFVCIINPGLAFDEQKNRLGKGKGYYDRFLSKLFQISKVKTLAVSLECQMVDSVPVEDYDIKMDEIILKDRIIK